MRLNIQLEKKGRIAERLVEDMKWLAEEDTRGWQRTRRGWQTTRGETGRRRDKRLEENNIYKAHHTAGKVLYSTVGEDGAEAGREQEVAGRRPEDRRGLIVQLSWRCRGGLWRGWQRTRGLQNSSLMFKYILSVIFLMLKLFRYCSRYISKSRSN